MTPKNLLYIYLAILRPKCAHLRLVVLANDRVHSGETFYSLVQYKQAVSQESSKGKSWWTNTIICLSHHGVESTTCKI